MKYFSIFLPCVSLTVYDSENMEWLSSVTSQSIKAREVRKRVWNPYNMWSRGSSVSIVSGYVLDDRAIGVRSPADSRGYFL
jgi:hypothetical protein